jgi:hypothetical protein
VGDAFLVDGGSARSARGAIAPSSPTRRRGTVDPACQPKRTLRCEGKAPHRPEHVAAHNPGADVLEAARGKVVVDAFSADLVTDQRSSEVGGHVLERLRAEDPLVQRHPSDAHRTGQILVGPAP